MVQGWWLVLVIGTLLSVLGLITGQQPAPTSEWRLHSTSAHQHGFILPFDVTLYTKLFHMNGSMSRPGGIEGGGGDVPTSVFIDFVGKWRQVADHKSPPATNENHLHGIVVTAWLYDSTALVPALQGYSFNGGTCETAFSIPDQQEFTRYHCDIGAVLHTTFPVPPLSSNDNNSSIEAAIGIQIVNTDDLEFILTVKPNKTKRAVSSQADYYWELTSDTYLYSKAKLTLFSRENDSAVAGGYQQPYIVVLEAAVVIPLPPVEPIDNGLPLPHAPTGVGDGGIIKNALGLLGVDKATLFLIVIASFTSILCGMTVFKSCRKGCAKRSTQSSANGADKEKDGSSSNVQHIGSVEIHTRVPYTSRMARRIRRCFGCQKQYRKADTELGVVLEGEYQVSTTTTRM